MVAKNRSRWSVPTLPATGGDTAEPSKPARGFAVFVEPAANGWTIHRLRMTEADRKRLTVASDEPDLPVYVIDRLSVELADYCATGGDEYADADEVNG